MTMTVSQVTSWAFLAAFAVMFNMLMHPPAPAGARPAVTNAPAVASSAAPTAPRSARALIVPVARIAPASLTDTWGEARSEGRHHEGIDILAARGTPVMAAADGRIVKFFDSVRGGVTIYQFDAREQFVYYYAHLESRADNLAEGDSVRQGDVIGFVGQSGNATTPHLHFEIQRLTPAKHWWQAEAMNPYPYLMSGEAPT